MITIFWRIKRLYLRIKVFILGGCPNCTFVDPEGGPFCCHPEDGGMEISMLYKCKLYKRK